MNNMNISYAGLDYAIWEKGLEFYRDELARMQQQLLEVAGKNTITDARKGVEHFQNQFLIQQKNISDLKHAVKKFVNELDLDARSSAGQISNEILNEGASLKERYEQQERVMNSLRHEFVDFLNK